MKIDRVRLSPVKGRNQIAIKFNRELLKDSEFVEGDYVSMIYDKDKMTMVKGEQMTMKGEQTVANVNVRLSPIKGRKQISVMFNKGLLKDSEFCEGDYVTMMCDKDRITMIKEDQIKGVNTIKDTNISIGQ